MNRREMILGALGAIASTAIPSPGYDQVIVKGTKILRIITVRGMWITCQAPEGYRLEPGMTLEITCGEQVMKDRIAMIGED